MQFATRDRLNRSVATCGRYEIKNFLGGLGIRGANRSCVRDVIVTPHLRETCGGALFDNQFMK